MASVSKDRELVAKFYGSDLGQRVFSTNFTPRPTQESRDGGSEPKELRSSEPDLKVILGSGEGQSIKWYHSPMLASRSEYIDVILATSVMEREARTITFPDITPKVWESMMKFFDDPIAIRQMKVTDVLEVAPMYDKYGFAEGLKLCGHVMLDSFCSLTADIEKQYMLEWMP
jgi:hypothetical protein